MVVVRGVTNARFQFFYLVFTIPGSIVELSGGESPDRIAGGRSVHCGRFVIMSLSFPNGWLTRVAVVVALALLPALLWAE
jgi:hypothetical protein